MNRRFEQVDLRFDGVEQRLDRVEQRLHRVEAVVLGHERQLRDANAQLGELRVAVDKKVDSRSHPFA